MRLLMQELQSRQAQQEQEHRDRMTCIRDSLEVTGGDFNSEGDVEDDLQEGRRSRPLQGMLSDNLPVDSVAFTNAIPSSLEDEEEGGHEYTSVLFNTEDEDYEDEEYQDEYEEDSEDDDVFRQEEDSDGQHQTLSSLNEALSSTAKVSREGSCINSSEESNSSSLCRLEPITSLFHSPSSSSPEDGSSSQSPTTSNSASPQTASVCEVVMG
ncbi:hypothetical protein ACTXT7_013933 [Hymenolepis weldensis]